MASPRLRVALVAVDLWEYTVALANALSYQCDVRLLLPQEALERHGPELAEGVTVEPFTKPRLRDAIGQIRMCRELVRRVDEIAPDVVHVQGVHLWLSLALPFLRRRPTILTVHDITLHPGDRNTARTPQWVRNRAFARADHLIVHAETLKRQLIAAGRADETAIHVVPHIELVEPATVLEGEEEDALLLFFGRIWPYKGLDYLLRAEPLIAREVPEVKTVIAGQGEDFARYEQLMAEPSRFEVHNAFVSNEQRASLFRRASVVVLPYVEASMSGVVPIAYAFGKPVIATTAGGLPEIVDHGRTGLLVPPRDERALADAVIELLRDPARRRELGENGRRKLELELSGEAVARRTVAVYERALQTHTLSFTGERSLQGAART